MFEINKLFKKKQYIPVTKLQEELQTAKPNIPNGMWVKCNNCGKLIYKDDLNKNLKVCDDCNYHFRLNGKERVSQIIDVDTFIEIDEKVEDLDPLNFQGYREKILKIREKSALDEAVITGKGKINGLDVVVSIMDSNFMMGSMGTTVGEKITRAIELATKENKPIIIFTASGGARMQEGIYSLMQMAKTSAALAKHSESGNLYITVLTDPTTGGVTASFAMLGDIILSEPNALIGFAGRRVIEQTIREELPGDFQRAEFLLKHGFIDKIVHRKDLKNILYRLLIYHNN